MSQPKPNSKISAAILTILMPERPLPATHKGRLTPTTPGALSRILRPYAADSGGPAFDPEELLAARRAGASVEELSDRAWALKSDLPNPLLVLMGG